MTTSTGLRSSTVSIPKVRIGRGNRLPLPHIAWWVVSLLLAAGFIYPLVVMVGMALKPEAEVGSASVLPVHPTVANFSRLTSVQGLNVFQNLINSVVVTLAATAGTVVVATLAGYALANTTFPGRRIVFGAILATFMIPFQAVITPLFLVLRAIGLNNSLVGLTLVYITFNLPFGLFIMRNAFAAIPRTIEEAGMIDGLGVLGSLRRVLLPLALPGVITTALLTFFATWNEFFAALVLLTDQDKFTLPVTLTLVTSGQFGTINWGALEAGVCLTVLPCIVVYLLLQRYYVGGVLSGAIK